MDPRPVTPQSPRIAVVVSRYNASVTDRLLEGALSEASRRGGCVVDVWHAPGAFELPTLADGALASGRYAGVVTLGCIIRGETSHDQHIASAVAQGIVQVSVKHGRPVTLGVLTVGTPEQALERAGGRHGNKGADAMGALLEVLDIREQAGIHLASMRRAPGTFTVRSSINDKASGSV